MLWVWGRGGVCFKRSGAREACCGSGDVEVFASRGLEACFGPGYVEVFASLLQELGRHAVGLGALPQELRSSRRALQALSLFA